MIIEAEKSQVLQSVSWRPKSTDGLSASLSLSSKTEDQCPSSKKGRESEFSCTQPSCSVQNSNGLDETHPNWGEKSAFFTL